MNKWMKIGGILLVAALMVTALGAFALAQGPQGNTDGVRSPVGAGAGPAWGFVDEDNDGINDRYEDGTLFVDEDGDGICDLCGSAEPLGPGYGAADETGTVGGYALNQADSAFVDEDGDGVCDNYGQYSQYSGQRMMGRGRWASGR